MAAKAYMTEAILRNLVASCGAEVSLYTDGKLHQIRVYGRPRTPLRKAGDIALWVDGYLAAVDATTRRVRR